MSPVIRTFQRCPADKVVFNVRVPSSSKDDVFYSIDGSFVKGNISCSCPGFQFTGQCKHIQVEVIRCGWSAVGSSEPQTMRDKAEHRCPVCGSMTMDEVRGDI